MTDRISELESKYAKELRKVRDQNRLIHFLVDKSGMWILLIAVVLLGTAVLGAIFTMRESTPMWVLTVGIIVTFVLGLGVIPLTMGLSSVFSRSNIELLKKLSDEGIDAETLLAMGDKHQISGAFDIALKKRCLELGLDHAPEDAVRDGRLPTSEDIPV